MPNYAYEMHAGDYHEVEMPTTIDGVVADLNGMEFVYVWANAAGKEPVITKTGVVSGENPVIVLDPADTDTLPDGEYYHECKIRNPVDQLPITLDFLDSGTSERLTEVKLLPSSAEFPE
jgi:hypothetical protein